MVTIHQYEALIDFLQVRVHDADKGETLHVFTPHCSRVKRLEVAHSDPHLLWSAGEDGLVM